MKNFKISSDGFMKADCKISGKHADLYSVRNLSDGPVTKFGKLSIIGKFSHEEVLEEFQNLK